ncbi:MAG: ATP-dependent DNA helicase [Proteobacteria bacterium]|nr:ATP-dependent DNA helicase [Pseudomonadota bacterium]MCG2751548.1 ATP-dependent DNA helicase [Desulfobacteraceae bacterium]
MKEKLQIAVRALVEQVLREGDLSFSFTGQSRTVEAIRAHQKVQKSRPAGYEPEVRVSHQLETETFLLEISGRIDGVYGPEENASEDTVVIDEIKTTTSDLQAYADSDHPIHWAQAKIYAYMVANARNLSRIHIQLTYYHLDTGQRLEIRRPFEFDTLADFFDGIVSRYLARASILAQWHETRNTSLSGLSFPFPDFRPGQREMAVQVYKTIQHQRQLLVQAPTGIGKTMAAVFPALKALGLGLVSKIFYLTARTTARAVAEKAASAMARKGLRVKSLTLTAKDKICFNPESACNAEECSYAKGHFDRVDAAIHDLFTSNQEALTREVVEEAARTHHVCPFEFSLDLTLWADMIICDYNYAFDPRVYLRRFFTEETGDYTFLVDEAHNLVDRSREMFSAELRKQPFLDLRKTLKEALPGLYKTIGRLNAQFVKIRTACEDAGGQMAQPEAPPEMSSLLNAFLSQAERWLVQNHPAAFREQLLDLYFKVGSFLKILEGYDENYITCAEKNDKDLRLKLFCINPADRMKAALARCRSVVFYSATLTPASYFKQLFGCGDEAFCLSLPSPFPKENFCLLLANHISTRYRNREGSLNDLVRLLSALISGSPGNLLIFFPSYQYMTAVHGALVDDSPTTEILIQAPGMSEGERERFLEQFTCEKGQRLVGFAVMGGVFGEGVDLEGERLTGAAIVGVGLPGISVENELIRQYFDRIDGTGFDHAYLYPGINRVLQAGGRVIRSETDQGVVMLIDERYTTARYRNLLPDHWQPVRVRNEKDLEKQLQKFWSSSVYKIGPN